MEKKNIKTGSSLASLAAQQQEKNKNNDIKASSNVLSLDIDRVSELAREVAASKPKLSAIYVSEEIKKELEKIKLLGEFDKLPISSIATAVFNEFLSMNETEIRERLRKIL